LPDFHFRIELHIKGKNKYLSKPGHSFWSSPFSGPKLKLLNRAKTISSPLNLQLTNTNKMSKSESDSNKAAAVEDDDEPDDW
jgi:hypothetical protein